MLHKTTVSRPPTHPRTTTKTESSSDSDSSSAEDATKSKSTFESSITTVIGATTTATPPLPRTDSPREKELRRQISALEKLLNTSQEATHKYRAQAADVTSRLASIAKQEAQLRKEKDAHEAKMQRFRDATMNQIAALRQQAEDFEVQRQDLEQEKCEVADQRQQLKLLQAQIRERAAMKQQQAQQDDKVQTTLLTFKTEMEELKKLADAKDQRIVDLERHLNKAKSTPSSRDQHEQERALKQEISIYKEKLHYAETQIEQLNRSLTVANTSVHGLQREVAQLQSSLHSKDDDIEHTKRDLTLLKQDKDHIQNDLTHYTKLCEELKTQENSLRFELLEKSLELDSYHWRSTTDHTAPHIDEGRRNSLTQSSCSNTSVSVTTINNNTTVDSKDKTDFTANDLKTLLKQQHTEVPVSSNRHSSSSNEHTRAEQQSTQLFANKCELVKQVLLGNLHWTVLSSEYHPDIVNSNVCSPSSNRESLTATASPSRVHTHTHTHTHTRTRPTAASPTFRVRSSSSPSKRSTHSHEYPSPTPSSPYSLRGKDESQVGCAYGAMLSNASSPQRNTTTTGMQQGAIADTTLGAPVKATTGLSTSSVFNNNLMSTSYYKQQTYEATDLRYSMSTPPKSTSSPTVSPTTPTLSTRTFSPAHSPAVYTVLEPHSRQVLGPYTMEWDLQIDAEGFNAKWMRLVRTLDDMAASALNV